jgi:hypothetical protein
LISLLDGAVVSLGALFSCTEDHGAAVVSEAENVIEFVLNVDIGSQKI